MTYSARNQGYVSLYSTNGSLHWKDKILHYPSLTLLDNFGDVTESDGNKLVHYDQDGTRYPVINLQDLRPMFNMALIGDDVQFLLFISENGNIVAMETNGVPIVYGLKLSISASIYAADSFTYGYTICNIKMKTISIRSFALVEDSSVF
ncbi:hypothetical protein DPMN_018221 [Dreissena polymorpha]|uniref:Uncharacterized protein n=1 Tax=Dreissena polymorpha TaxID=45954 RepID=A0A9D4NIC0_DREPO|nr:hypothetical protein DPMN_018221 [Dreissena polymorpha]